MDIRIKEPLIVGFKHEKLNGGGNVVLSLL